MLLLLLAVVVVVGKVDFALGYDKLRDCCPERMVSSRVPASSLGKPPSSKHVKVRPATVKSCSRPEGQTDRKRAIAERERVVKRGEKERHDECRAFRGDGGNGTAN